jgi:hypothetical protein
MQTMRPIRAIIDRAVFNSVSDAVNEYEADEDDIWFTFMSIDDIYDDALLIPHFYVKDLNS